MWILGRESMLWTEEQRRYLDSKQSRKAKLGLATTLGVALSRGELSTGTGSWMSEPKVMV